MHQSVSPSHFVPYDNQMPNKSYGQPLAIQQYHTTIDQKLKQRLQEQESQNEQLKLQLSKSRDELKNAVKWSDWSGGQLSCAR